MLLAVVAALGLITLLAGMASWVLRLLDEASEARRREQ